MTDYNVHLYQKCDNRICKFPYITWCQCERPSRRRSRSETNDPCRRKCRNNIKKLERSQEYENMDIDLDFELAQTSWCDMKTKERYGDCCNNHSRVLRSNLVELPTSYINNCQSSPSNVTNFGAFSGKMSSDKTEFIDCLEKSVRTYEQTIKHVGYSNDSGQLSPNNSKAKSDDYKCVVRRSAAPLNVNVRFGREMKKDAQFSAGRTNLEEFVYSKPTFGNSCSFRQTGEPPITHRMHPIEPHTHSEISYETGTYFDKQKDPRNLQSLYSREVDILREKLRELKNTAYTTFPPKTTTESGFKYAVAKDSQIAAETVENVYNESEKKRIKSPPMKRFVSRAKVSVKTRSKMTGSTCRLVKARPKSSTSIILQSESDGTESDYSDSDESEQINLEEEIESSDPSSEKSNDSITSITQLKTEVVQIGSGDAQKWPIRHSQFPHIPPYILFSTHDAENVVKVPGGRKLFKWKLSTITPIIVRKTLSNSGFVLVRKSNQWMGTWGKHLKSPLFKTLKESQKLNHFPGTFQLGRKDRLWRNFQRAINKYGYKEFGFLPQTFVLPQELKFLKQNWDFKNGKGGDTWIIKPPASARGVGIKVINKWSQLPKKCSLVVQKYISNPYLINGSKFDLRLYCLVTSFNPLRIYLYPEGLARFASVKYSDDINNLKDRYMHLTNYSINKLSSQYTANEDANACQGHKWTLTKLLEFMEKRGVDVKILWRNLQSLVVKTIISSEGPITEMCEQNMNNRYNCYELFGIDVLLDEKLKPWLLEVNISPSLHSSSPLDATVKGPLVQTIFNMAQFHFPQRLNRYFRPCPASFEPKLYTTNLTKKERIKHLSFKEFERRTDYLTGILDDLTGDDLRQLTQAEDELVVKGRFEKLFPTANSYKYLEFMEPRYYNRLFDAWETKYENNRDVGIQRLKDLCSQKIHLKIAPKSSVTKNVSNMSQGDLKLAALREESSCPLEKLQEVSIN